MEFSKSFFDVFDGASSYFFEVLGGLFLLLQLFALETGKFDGGFYFLIGDVSFDV
jgi:hypothetical protein